MIDALLQFGAEVILIRVEGNKVLFGNTLFGTKMADIKGLKLDYGGVCREFPDLELHDDWKGEAIKRFKKKIADFQTEKMKVNYIIDELMNHGYKPIRIQKKGFRTQKWGSDW
jgi:hypothetical protein